MWGKEEIEQEKVRQKERERGTETGQNCIDRIKRRTGRKAYL